MNGNFEECLAHTLREEGGFVNHPQDPGGMTNLGITKRTYEGWIKRPVEEQEMRALTPKDVEPIYRYNYWMAVKGDELPTGVDLVVFDLGVNSGPTTAIKFLQRAVGVPADGLFGPKTRAAVAAMKPDDIIRSVCEARLNFLKGLSTWPVFGKGWGARVKRVQETALKMSAVRRKPALEGVRPDVA